MTTWLILLLAFMMFLALPMARAADATAPATTPVNIAAENSFAADLFAHLTTGSGATPPAAKGNLFFSPYSIRTALTMTRAGARGDTARQMAAVLHLPASLPPDELHRAFASLIKDLNADSKDYQLAVANALW